MPKKKSKLPAAKAPELIDDLLAAVRGSNESAARLHQLSEQMRDSLYQLQGHLQLLMQHPRLFAAPEAEAMLRRIDRLLELRNMQELGSFKVTVERGMEGIWQRVPK
jgi:DNA-directed RNA polymerase subunit F